jgi:hypothetical protein
MNSQLKNILHAERIDVLLSIAKEKPVSAVEYFIKAGEVPFKVSDVFDGLLHQFQAGKIATTFVTVLSPNQPPKN